MGASLYTSRIILNALGVNDFGTYNVVGGVITFFTFLNSSMAGATSRFLTIELGKQNYNQFKKIFNVSIVNHIILGLIIIVLAETIGLWFVENKLVIPADRKVIALWVYQFSIFSAFITILQVPFSATIISHEKMTIYAYAGIVESILKLMIAFSLTLIHSDKLLFYALAIFGTTIIMTIFYSLYVRKAFSYCRFQVQKDKILYKQTLAYSGWDLLGNFSIVAQGQGLNMLLNIFFGPAVNAARGIAYQIQGAITQFGNNFMLASRPQIIKYYAEGEREKMMKLVFNSAKYSFFLLWLLSLPVLIETKYILTLWLKNVPDHTIAFTRLVLLTSLITAFRNPFIAAMHSTGKIKLPNIICGFLLIATLPISYLFLKAGYNAETVFVIMLLITFSSMWIEWILIKRAIYFSIRAAISKVLFISLIIVLLSLILPIIIYYHIKYGFFRFCILSIISTLSVLISVFLIGMSKHDCIVVTSKIKKILFKH